MDYKTLKKQLKLLKRNYKVYSIGSTEFKRKIYAVEKCNGKSLPTAFLVAGMHAREHITTDLVIKFLKQQVFDEIKNFNVAVVPMSNPDGVELETNGLCSAPKKQHQNLLILNGGSSDFSQWKANGRGTDINNNFDANFGTNTHSNSPAPHGFPGEFAESSAEARALADFTKKRMPFIVISYHSKGEEIYYNFFQYGKRLERDSLIADEFAKSTGYLIKNPEKSSSGGYKDWCVQKLKITSLTVEVGSDALNHPIKAEHLDEIYDKNKMIAKNLDYAYNVVESYGKI